MSDAATTHGTTNGDASSVDFAGARSKALLLGIGGLIAFGVIGGILTSAGQAETKQFFLSYLTGFVFWVSLAFGACFFLFISYVTGGRWGIFMRRSLEANAKSLAFGFVLSLPVLASYFVTSESSAPYWWAVHHHHMAEHADKSHVKSEDKDPYNRDSVTNPDLEHDETAKVNDLLSPSFTAGRHIIYFVVFALLILWMNKNAMTAEYNPDEKVASSARIRQKYLGAVGLYVFPVALTLIVTDWVMSLEKTFNSTMFPVIFFGNAALCTWAFGILTLIWLKKQNHPLFVKYFTPGESIHVGGLLLAFTLFWTYTNFSQFMLTWVGNLTEEIPYYLRRSNGGWEFIAYFMMVFHFFVPFILLLFRHIKSNQKAMQRICIGLLIVCAVDVFWWINPSVSHEGIAYFLMDVAAWIGVGGLWMWYYLGQLSKHPLMPTREVSILEAYHHGH